MCHEHVQELSCSGRDRSGPDGLTHAFSEGLTPGCVGLCTGEVGQWFKDGVYPLL